MTLQSVMKSGRTSAVLCGLVLASGFGAFRAQADEWDKRTILTIDQPIQITDTYLEPGTYVMKLVRSDSDRHIVQIFNQDESQVIDTVLAIPNYRLQPTGKSQFIWWETPSGTARAMRAWFYPGDNFGQEFRYPKELRQLAAVRITRTASAPAPQPMPEAVPEPPAPVQPIAAAPERDREEQSTVIIAQNIAPQSLPAAEPAPQGQPIPQQLPHTASQLPFVGLTGLLSLGVYGVLRMKGTA